MIDFLTHLPYIKLSRIFCAIPSCSCSSYLCWIHHYLLSSGGLFPRQAANTSRPRWPCPRSSPWRWTCCWRCWRWSRRSSSISTNSETSSSWSCRPGSPSRSTCPCCPPSPPRSPSRTSRGCRRATRTWTKQNLKFPLHITWTRAGDFTFA